MVSPRKLSRKEKGAEAKSLTVRKNDLERALELIRRQNESRKSSEVAQRLKITEHCSRDPAVINYLRPAPPGRPSVTQQLLDAINRAVAKHDWSALASCIEFLLSLNGKLIPVVWKSVILVLIKHQDSGQEKIDDFLQMCLGLRTDAEKLKYVKELFSLPSDLQVYATTKTKSKTSVPETTYIDLDEPDDILE